MGKWLFDPGHGGSDSGAILGSRKESNDVLKLCGDVAALMEFNGESIYFTRTTDATVSLDARSDKDKAGNYDYFVSFHRNADKGKAYGVETFSYRASGAGRALSEKVQGELKKFFIDRGCKTANFHVLRETKSPAILIEFGFIDNPGDNSIFDSKYKEIVQATARGLLKQVGKDLKLPEAPKPPVSKGSGWRVCIGYYEDKANADKMMAEAKAKGFDAFLAPYEK